MATWSSRRKFSIAITALVLIVAIVLGIYFIFFYKAPTCFDRIMNGDELGVDCGGSCKLLCQSAFLPAKIAWGGGKSEKVSEGYYNVAAKVINTNTNAAAENVPYKFALYDDRGLLIIERSGRITIPAHRDVLVFEPAVNTAQRIPTKVTFEFTKPPMWFKSHDTLGELMIRDKNYTEDTNSSSLQVGFENRGHTALNNITVGAILYDLDGNAIGFSRTKMDVLRPGAQEIAPFTWPYGREGKVVSVEALPVVTPVRD